MRLIDADALMKEFAKFVRRSNNSDFAPIPTWNDAVSLTEDAPTVDAVERKRGEWVDNGLDSIGFMGIEYRLQKCSNCGETITKAPMQRLPNFCSNCGADMRGEQE